MQLPRSKPSPFPAAAAALSTPLARSTRFHPHCGRANEKKKRKKKGNKEEGNPPTILAVSRPRLLARSFARSCLRVADRCLNGLVSTRLISSRPAPPSVFLSRPSRIPVSHPPPRVVLILAKCCDRHPPFVYPPPGPLSHLRQLICALSLSLFLCRSLSLLTQ